MRKRHGAPVLALVVALSAIALPDRAYAPFRGMLQQGSPFTIEVSNNINNTDACAVTVLMVTRQGRIINATPTTVPPNTTGTITDTAASNVDRVLVILNPPLPGSLGPPIVTVRTSQNNAVLANDMYQTDTEIVFDAVP